MKGNEFLSSNRYIYLPTKKRPKVSLSIDSKEISNTSFKLYNPFSFKGKCLKIIIKMIQINFNIYIKFYKL